MPNGHRNGASIWRLVVRREGTYAEPVGARLRGDLLTIKRSRGRLLQLFNRYKRGPKQSFKAATAVDTDALSPVA